MRAWLSAARLRARRGLKLDFPERRRELVRRLAPGRSFIDVGGMWNIDGEIAFLAEECGAGPVTVLDLMPASDRFERERGRRGSSVRLVRGDLHDADLVSELGRYDIVWCTGVIYHSPNPFDQLRHLWRLTGEQLLLGSHVIPELPGIEHGCIWYPGISPAARAAFRQAHGGARAPERAGVTSPFDPSPEAEAANWWWGITPSALRSMVEAAGFTVAEELRYTTFLLDLLARPSTASERR